MVHDLVWRKCSSFSLYPHRGYIAPPKMKVPPDEKTCGHTACKEDWVSEKDSVFVNGSAMMR